MIENSFKNTWRKLKEKVINLKKENSRINKLLEEEKRKNKELQEKIEKLEQEINAIRVAAKQKSEAERQELKKIIDLYICEIDECIALIQNEGQ